MLIILTAVQRDRNGIMGWPEFLELQKCLVYWYRTFCQYDGDRSGYIEANELFNVIKHNYGKDRYYVVWCITFNFKAT